MGRSCGLLFLAVALTLTGLGGFGMLTPDIFGLRFLRPLPESLPVASNAKLVCCVKGLEEVSLNPRGGWEIRGQAVSDLGSELAERKARWESAGYPMTLRVRIEARAPARHFVELMENAESGGIERVLVAVIPYSP